MMALVLIAAVVVAATVAPSRPRPFSLSEPKLLLPIVSADSPLSSHTLTTSHGGGCFEWSSRRPDVASVQALYEDERETATGTDMPGAPPDTTAPWLTAAELPAGHSACSRAAVVTASRATAQRAATDIVARDRTTGHEIRCQVIVDHIHRISVVTTTRTIFLDETPEVLDVLAFDGDDNKFSTRERIAFNWRLLPAAAVVAAAAVTAPLPVAVDATTIMRIVDFRDSEYDASDAVDALELQGKRGHLLLLEGISSGRARVAASIADPIYAHVPASEVVLFVMEKLEFKPALVFLLPGMVVDFTLTRIRELHKLHSQIDLPSNNYHLAVVTGVPDGTTSSACPLVGRLTPAGTGLQALHCGQTAVVVVDKRLRRAVCCVWGRDARNCVIDLEYDAHQQPRSTVHVVDPAFVKIRVDGRDNVNVLQNDEVYVITLLLGVREHNETVAHSNFFYYAFRLNNLYFEPLFSTANQSYHVVRARAVGSSEVAGDFLGLHGAAPDEIIYAPPYAVSGQLQLDIFAPVRVLPPLVTLPWTLAGHRYHHALKAEGGSGHFTWHSRLPAVASVNAHGVVTALLPGVADIVVTDRKNPRHFATAVVHVEPPAALHFPPCVLEARVGSVLELPVVVSGKSGRVFDDCRGLDLQWDTEDSTVFLRNTTSPTSSSTPGSACLWLTLAALKEGITRVHATLGALTAAVAVYAYNPLRVVSPNVTALVTFGASVNFVCEGGPLVLPDAPELHRHLLSTAAPSGVRLLPGSLLRGSHRVVCAAVGQHVLTLTVHNDASSLLLPFPRAEVITLTLLCEHPAVVTLTPLLHPTNEPADCLSAECAALRVLPHPLQAPHTVHHVLVSQTIDVAVGLRNSAGRFFDNFSTAVVHWSKDCSDDLVALALDPGEHLATSQGQACRLGSTPTAATVVANVTGYFTSEASALTLPEVPLLPSIVECALALQILDNHRLAPSSVTLFNHPDVHAIMTISRGSGVFTGAALPLDSGPVSVASHMLARAVNVTPIQPGLADMKVTDTCLKNAKPASARVLVSDVARFAVELRSLLQVDHTMVATVCALDSTGHEFAAHFYPYINLTVHSATEGIMAIAPVAVTEHTPSKLACAGRQFLVKGLAVGNSLVTFSAFHATHTQQSITSDPVDVQVFPPLLITPRDVLLLPGARFQVRAEGGPRHVQRDAIFRMGNATVAAVDGAGLIFAHVVGQTVLQASIQALDALTQEMVTCAQDEVNVRVALLTGVRIRSPITRLHLNAEINVHAEGLHGETPFTFGSVGLPFDWTVDNPSVLGIRSLYHADHISLEEERDFGLQVTAQRIGVADVRVAVSAAHISSLAVADAVLHSALRFEVHEQLRVLAGSHILLPFGAQFDLLTNRPGHSALLFEVLTNVSSACVQEQGLADDLDASDGGVKRVDAVATVTRQGRVTTFGVSGTVPLRVSLVEDGTLYAVLVLVEVAPLAHLSAVPTAQLWPSVAGSLNRHPRAPFFLPIGVSAELTVVLHDRAGRPFHSASGVVISHRLQRFDVVKIREGETNADLVVAALNEGDVVLRVFVDHSQHPFISDFIRIRVKSAIEPANALVHIGARPCLTTALDVVSHSGSVLDGYWTSSNADVLDFSPSSLSAVRGVTQAEGTTLVQFVHGEISTHTHLRSARVGSIDIDTSHHTIVSNVAAPNLPGTYTFPIAFSTSLNEAFTGIGVCGDAAVVDASTFSQQVPFECMLTPARAAGAFAVAAVFDKVTGGSACTLRPLFSQSAEQYFATSLSLVVTAHDVGRTYQFSRQSVLPFVPQLTASVTFVALSNTNAAATIVVNHAENRVVTVLVGSAQGSQPVTPTRRHSAPGALKWRVGPLQIKQEARPAVAPHTTVLVVSVAPGVLLETNETHLFSVGDGSGGLLVGITVHVAVPRSAAALHGAFVVRAAAVCDGVSDSSAAAKVAPASTPFASAWHPNAIAAAVALFANLLSVESSAVRITARRGPALHFEIHSLVGIEQAALAQQRLVGTFNITAVTPEGCTCTLVDAEVVAPNSASDAVLQSTEDGFWSLRSAMFAFLGAIGMWVVLRPKHPRAPGSAVVAAVAAAASMTVKAPLAGTRPAAATRLRPTPAQSSAPPSASRPLMSTRPIFD